MIDKLAQLVAIIATALFSLMTGNALALAQYEHAVRYGAAGIVLLIIALIGTFNGCPDATAQNNPLHGSDPQDRS